MMKKRIIDFFFVDTGYLADTYSLLNTKVTKESLDTVKVTGVTGQLPKQAFLQPLEGQLGD